MRKSRRKELVNLSIFCRFELNVAGGGMNFS
jgi:hypothetical protein